MRYITQKAANTQLIILLVVLVSVTIAFCLKTSLFESHIFRQHTLVMIVSLISTFGLGYMNIYMHARSQRR